MESRIVRQIQVPLGAGVPEGLARLAGARARVYRSAGGVAACLLREGQAPALETRSCFVQGQSLPLPAIGRDTVTQDTLAPRPSHACSGARMIVKALDWAQSLLNYATAAPGPSGFGRGACNETWVG